MSLSLRIQHPCEPAVITTRCMLITNNKAEGLTFRETANSWCGMQGVKQVAYTPMFRQRKCEITTQMYQVCSPDCIWSFLVEIIRKLFQTLCNISGHITLLLNILCTPTDTLAFALQLFSLQLHCSSQSYSTPSAIVSAFQQNLRCGL